VSSCSKKCLVSNNYCENLPIVNKQNFQSIINNEEIFNILLQVKSIKDCGCLEPSLQNQCFNKFKLTKK